MTNSPFETNAKECSANSAEYVLQKPCVGGHMAAKLAQDVPMEFGFALADLTGVQVVDGGDLLLSFKNGGTLTIENFMQSSETAAFKTITFSDGEVMNLEKFMAAFEDSAGVIEKPTALDISILKPVGAIGVTSLAFDYDPNNTYTLDIDASGVESTAIDGDRFIITFKDGSELILNGFGIGKDKEVPLTLADGSVIPAGELITLLATSPVGGIGATAMTFEVVEEAIEEVVEKAAQDESVREVAEIEPAAGPQQLVKTDSGTDVAGIEPQAGEAQGGLENTGASFGSTVNAGNIGGIDAVGPIGPTSLQFDRPDAQDDNPFLPVNNNPGTPGTPPGDPSLTLNDTFGFEDNLIDLGINASPDVVGVNEVITVTITNIPTGWDVVGPGTFNPTSGTWTFTVPAGQPFTGGPSLLPPLNDDCDLSGAGALSVSVVTIDTTTGLTSNVVTDTMEVVVDAVADAPNQTATDVSGFEDTDILLNLNFSLNDTDGSEEVTSMVITGVPAGFTIVNGTDLGGGQWSINPTNINNIFLRAPNGFSGDVNLGLETVITETTLCGNEITITNNSVTTTTPFVVGFEARADAPTLVVDNPIVKEDGTVNLNISATLNDPDGSETLTVTVTGIDNTWTINNADGTYNAATGTWTITLPAGQNYAGFLNFTPPADSDVDMNNIQVTATATEPNGSNSTTSATVDILTDAVADAPTLSTSDVTGTAGTSYALNINPALTDTDGSETLSAITITGVPTGFSLNLGTNLGGGVWEVQLSDLPNLQLNTPAGYNGTISLGVSVTSTEGVTDGEIDLSDNTATTTGTIDVTLSSQAVPPTLTVAGTHDVYEDGTVFVPISATLNGSGTEVLTITVTGIDSSWTINNANGTYNAATGTWAITLPAGQNYNGGLTFTPPADSDVDMTGLVVTATASENGTSAQATQNTEIVVDAVADAPIIDGQDASGSSNSAIDLVITNSLTDTDGSETLGAVTITGVPNGFSLNVGTNLGGGTWQVSQADLANLKLNVPDNYSGNVTLGVSVTSTEGVTDGELDLTNNTATSTDTLTVTITDQPDAPTLTVAGQHQVLEDNSVFVPFSATLNGSGAEILTVTVSGIDSSWTINNANGTYNAATGTWTITLPAGQNYNGGLTFTPPANSDVDLTGMVVTASAFEPSSGTSAQVTANTSVIVDAVADAPTLVTNNVNAEEGDIVDLNISTAVTDTDGSESITKIEISNVPSGFSLSAGTNLGGGVWELTPAQLANLKLTPPANYYGTLNLTVTSYSYDNPTDTDFDLTNNEASITDTLTINYLDKPNPPTLDVDGVHQVYEDGSVFVPFSATLNGSPNEVLTVTVSGIDSSWTINNANGTYNAATGTWTITLPAGQSYSGGLTFIPPANSDVDLSGINVTATATLPSTGDTSSVTEVITIIVDAVADAPDLDVGTGVVVGDAGDALPLDISAALTDTDGSEVLSTITISGVPSGYSFNGGTDLGGGVWQFTSAQLNGLTVTPPQNAHGAVSFIVSVTSTEQVTDNDFNLTNNTATTTQTLVVNVRPDSIPEINPIATIDVQEATLDNGTITVGGQVTANFGSDNLGAFCIPANGQFRATGQVAGGALTSGGVAVVVAIIGDKYVGTANGQTVFELTLNPNGSYTFQQFAPLDHADTNSSNEQIILNFDIKVEDNDGDVSETATITVAVQDDGVVAVDDWAVIPTCDGYVNGNVIEGNGNGTGGSADDLSVDGPNTVSGVYDKWGNFHEIVEGQSIAIQGEFGKLYINSDGTYSYQVEEWGDQLDFDPTAADFNGGNRAQLTRDGITVSVGNPLYGGQSKGQLTWNAGGIGITGNGGNKINVGEVVTFDFANNGVYNVQISLGGIAVPGAKIMDYSVEVMLSDGSTRVIFGQKAIPTSGGNGVFTLDTWNDLNDPDIVSIKSISIFSENDTPFEFVIKDVDAQEHLYESFEYVLMDGDGDTSNAFLYLQAKAAEVTFNSDTIYVGASRQDVGDEQADGTSGNDLILGWTGNDTLRGLGGDDTLAGWSGNDNLYGGAGNDILLGEVGADNLWGGSGADIFVVDDSDGGNIFDRIHDFNATQGDVIDLSSLIDNFDPNDPIGNYVRIVNDGGKAMVQINSDGAGNDWINAIRIENETAGNLNVDDLFNNGNIDVT